ncbi:hypothetical protein [Streptomyces anulatus]|uniref:hypothetical protein n=1 Tax=Streptomyces anulatus TaxID=1892 RepID=UPI003430E70F
MTGNVALDPFVIAGIIAAGLGLLFVLARIGKRVWLMFQALDDFLDDWRGTPARSGVEARPGVLARLSAIEHEVKTNNGSSLKDAVKRCEGRLIRVEQALDLPEGEP